ncbi:MAG: type II secretion system protein [Gemmatimonadetes bacterium]|nr:type II secretion system protein [Gemmatimonadota bacterium]
MVSRGGFTLVEVIVATTLLSVAVLCVAASGTLASSLLRTAQREEAAARVAQSLMDSLVLTPDPRAGTRADGPMTVTWSAAAGGEVIVWVGYEDGGTRRVLCWRGRSLVRLQRLPPADTDRP